MSELTHNQLISRTDKMMLRQVHLEAEVDRIKDMNVPEFKVKYMSDRASMEHNIRVMNTELDRLRIMMEEEKDEKDTIALVLDQTADKVGKLEPKGGILKRISGLFK